MAIGKTIRTYYNGTWHDGDAMIIRAADHAAWLGSSVFDGARQFEGITPDLEAHCARVNRSAHALMITPTHTTQEIMDIAKEGLEGLAPDAAVYIRPMYWGIDSGVGAVAPAENSTGFALCLEEIDMPSPEASTTLTTTRFRRPVLESSVTNAKAGCLYPNNGRMLREAASKGFGNALVADALGNVAETASANVFMVRDGVVFTPEANGCFLAGITRARHIKNLREDGIEVHETTLSFDDFRQADEIFLSGNYSKVTPVSAFDDRKYEHGPITKRARALYWDWAHSGK